MPLIQKVIDAEDHKKKEDKKRQAREKKKNEQKKANQESATSAEMAQLETEKSQAEKVEVIVVPADPGAAMDQPSVTTKNQAEFAHPSAGEEPHLPSTAEVS